MKRYLLFLICIFCLIDVFSQSNRNNIWYFGEYAGLDFNNNPPTALVNSAMTQLEGCASMSDNSGHILFYSDGITVWNRNHQVMFNGTGLLGNESSTQSAIIIPNPSYPSIYYIFTVPAQNDTVPFSYSIIDMTLDGSLGAITIKNIPLHVPVTEKLTATLQANGTDYWVVVKEFNTDAILSYSVTATGVDPNPVISHVGIVPVYGYIGYARISPNGSKLCIAYLTSQANGNVCQLFDFNNNTGMASNPIDLITIPFANNNPYGVEFSPDNTKLYICESSGAFTLRQYDLSAGSPANIQNSVTVIVHEAFNQSGAAIALGPDNKIYVDYFHRPFLSVIDQPNLAGAACNYIFQAVNLAGRLCGIGLPNSTRYATCPSSLNINNNINICSNQTYQLPSGTVVNTSGIYSDTIRNQAGTCDSIIYAINLSISPVSLLSTGVHICPTQTYQLPSGVFVNTAGIYLDTLRNIAGCDSILNTIHLFVDHVSLQNADVHICPNQTYHLPSGTIVSTEGIYLDTLRSQASCDSIINTIHLFIDAASLRHTEVHICPNQTYSLPSGIVVSSEGIYTDTLRSQAHCDSIINTIHLLIDHVSRYDVQVQICSNQTYALPSGMIVTTSGTYIDTLRSQAFCDSIINSIHLTVNDISSVNQVDSIFAGQNYTLPSGVIVSLSGTYQSTLINSLGCDSVIATTLTLRKTIAECLTLKNAFTPNGDGINDYWILYKYNCFKKLEVNVYNRYGSLVYHSDDYKNDWNGKYKNKELPDGTYYYIIKVISFDDKEHVFRDNVTIIR